MRTLNPSVITASSAKFLIGKVINLSQIGIQQIPCATVRCDRNDFYDHTKMYYVKSTDFLALDEEHKSSLGDMVLIRAASHLANSQSQYKHFIEKVVFKYGKIVDPVTGKHVVEQEFSDEKLLRNKHWYVGFLKNFFYFF